MKQTVETHTSVPVFEQFVARPASAKAARPATLMYAVNSGPANVLRPIALHLLASGEPVVCRLGEPATSYMRRNIGETLHKETKTPPIHRILVGGHIHTQRALEDIRRVISAYPEARIYTFDDMFDNSLPLIEALRGSNIYPHIAFIMNKQSLPKVKEILHKAHDNKPHRVILTNSPSFEPFYNRETQWDAIRQKFRNAFGITDNEYVLTYFGAPNYNYPIAPDGRSHNDVVFTALRTALSQVNTPVTCIYRPHTREQADTLPVELQNITPHIRSIHKPRAFWLERGFTTHDAILGSELGITTNSTVSLEQLTARGLGLPAAIPIDVSLTKDIPDFPANRTLRALNIIPSIQSSDELRRELPGIIAGDSRFISGNEAETLRKLGWEQSPLSVFIREL